MKIIFIKKIYIQIKKILMKCKNSENTLNQFHNFDNNEFNENNYNSFNSINGQNDLVNNNDIMNADKNKEKNNILEEA